MVDRKEGCRVEIALTCVDENGKEISNIPADGSGWGGFDRYEANIFSLALSAAVLKVAGEFNEQKYGPGKGQPPRK